MIFKLTKVEFEAKTKLTTAKVVFQTLDFKSEILKNSFDLFVYESDIWTGFYTKYITKDPLTRQVKQTQYRLFTTIEDINCFLEERNLPAIPNS